MENEVVKYYENYREEDRITTNNARRIEFLTTVKKFDELFKEKQLKILDCAAGTGAYAFYLADKGHRITAADITPRHIDFINEQLKDKPYTMDTMVLDAADMSCYDDESFDVVLNMGPFYHLTDRNKRIKCFEESLRVLKKGGYLAVAYIPALYLNQMIAVSDEKYVDAQFLNQIKDTGIMRHDDPKCFWTDTYYSSDEEMQKLFREYDLETVVHFAQDGMAPLFHNTVDKWSAETFKTWYDYHLSVCTEKTIIDMSNHVLIIGKKKSLE